MKKNILNFYEYSNPWSCLVFGTKEFNYQESYELFKFSSNRNFTPNWVPDKSAVLFETVNNTDLHISQKKDESNLYLLPSFQTLSHFSLPSPDNKIYLSGGYCDSVISVESNTYSNFLFLYSCNHVLLIELKEAPKHQLIEEKFTLNLNQIKEYSESDFFINAAPDNFFTPNFKLGPIFNKKNISYIDIFSLNMQNSFLMGISACGELIVSKYALERILDEYPFFSFKTLLINEKNSCVNGYTEDKLYKLNVNTEDVIDIKASKSEILGITHQNANIVQFEKIFFKENKEFPPVLKLKYSHNVFLFKKEFLDSIFNIEVNNIPSFEFIAV